MQLGLLEEGGPWFLPLHGRQSHCGVGWRDVSAQTLGTPPPWAQCCGPSPVIRPVASFLVHLASAAIVPFHRAMHAAGVCAGWTGGNSAEAWLGTQDVLFAACSTLAQISSRGIEQNTFCFRPNYVGKMWHCPGCPETSLTLGKEPPYLPWLVPLWLVLHRGATAYVSGSALHRETVTGEDRE